MALKDLWDWAEKDGWLPVVYGPILGVSSVLRADQPPSLISKVVKEVWDRDGRYGLVAHRSANVANLAQWRLEKRVAGERKVLGFHEFPHAFPNGEVAE